VHGADAPGGQPPRAATHVVLNVARGQHRPRLRRPGDRPKPMRNSSLASGHFLVSLCTHSKCLLRAVACSSRQRNFVTTDQAFRVFSAMNPRRSRLYWG
jgi:hypothetical protein